MPRSRLALAAAILGGLGVLDVVLGPALIHLGVVSPMMGFQWFFGLGLLEGILALVIGLIALFRTRAGSGKGGRPLAIFGVACGVLLVGLLFVAAGPSSDLPPINDITTDLADPPAFTSDPAERDRDMAYPSDWVPLVANAYPDLDTLASQSAPTRALELAEATASKLGWEVVTVDADAGTVLAREATSVFQFVDDVVIRVRPDGQGGSLIDLRSKSRDGRGDLGANAARIRRFVAAFPG